MASVVDTSALAEVTLEVHVVAASRRTALILSEAIKPTPLSVTTGLAVVVRNVSGEIDEIEGTSSRVVGETATKFTVAALAAKSMHTE